MPISPTPAVHAGICARCRRSPSTRRARATSTTRSPPPTRRTARAASGCTSRTSVPTCGPGRRLIGRPTGARRACTCPARSSRCSRARCPTMPARSSRGRTGLPSPWRWSIDGDRVRQPAFYRSVIRSDERLDYDRVDRMFAGRESASGVWAAGLACARAAAAALAARRGAQGALEIDSAEPEFEFGSRGDVVSIRPVQQTESHRMIEHLMIAANEQVAQFLTARRVPALYRVHERPDGDRRRAPDRSAGLARRADAARAEGARHPAAGGGPDRAGLASDRELDRALAGTGPARVDQPRAALAQAGLLRPAQPRARRAATGAATATSPRRSDATRI